MDTSSVFYRYVRPLKFDPSRVELVTQPRGGVCFRFEVLPRPPAGHGVSDLWFTYARCHDDDLFSKKVAKRIVDGRAKNAAEQQWHTNLWLGCIPYSQNIEELCAGVLKFCSTQKISPRNPHHLHYLQVDLLDLYVALRNLLQSNAREQAELNAALKKAGEMNTAERYRNANR